MRNKGIAQKVSLQRTANLWRTVHHKCGTARGCEVGQGTEGWTDGRLQSTEGFVFLVIPHLHPPPSFQVCVCVGGRVTGETEWGHDHKGTSHFSAPTRI